MAHRKMVCTHQVINLEADEDHSQFRTDNCTIRSSTVNFPNQNIQLAVAASRNASDVEIHHYQNYYDRRTRPGNQDDHIQNCHLLANHDLGSAITPNFYNPCLFPSSSGRFFQVPWNSGSSDHMPPPIDHQAVATNMYSYGRNYDFVEHTSGSIKRKNVEVVPGYHSVNGFASSSSSSSNLSQNFGLQQWESPYNAEVLPDATTFTPAEYHRNGILPTSEGSSRSARNRSAAISLQPESAGHANYVQPSNYVGQFFPSPSNPWVTQSGSNIAGGTHQNYVNAITNLQGSFLGSGTMDMANAVVQGCQNGLSSLHHGSSPYFYQHQRSVQNMQSQTLIHQAQASAPYQYQFNNLLPGCLNPSSSGLLLGPRVPSFLSNGEHFYMPSRHQIQANAEHFHGSVRTLPPEHAAFLELSGLYGAGNVDEHRDMRLDIDSMTYEELLALEEQIGDVNTGLTEESILKNLKTSLYVTGAVSSSSDWLAEFAPEDEACVICQVEYKEKETIGTLDCGHKYHADCIKQWLLLKNLCPICKISALSADTRTG
ncbi:probable E3 ubiquitin-protein ligase ZFP1 isoform X1 [Typha angustifolia]|uniref:probable E3 ubiquitin-protein ligase ZFP1 isoform X1 n=1 Tax=Typha angustifolia TaxID=59011 RepID=UPI003C2E77B1